jgi:hypothetical protein
MTWKTPLEVTHDDYIVDKTGGIVPLDEIVAALNAAPPGAFDELTEDALEVMVEASFMRPGGPVVLQTLLHLLKAFAAPKGPQWQLIETAPKDGTPFLGYTKTRFEAIIAVWLWEKDKYNKKPNPYFARDGFHAKTDDRANQPTHWMPLPAGPEGGAA